MYCELASNPGSLSTLHDQYNMCLKMLCIDSHNRYQYNIMPVASQLVQNYFKHAPGSPVVLLFLQLESTIHEGGCVL